MQMEEISDYLDRWASVLSSDRGRESGDIHSSEDRRAEADVYGVYGESRTRNSTGTQERIGQNFEDAPEEVKRIVAELRKMYGFTENHQTNDIAPTKEVSSIDDAFFDGKNPKYPLSDEGEQLAPIGNYSTPLNETALEQDIAPVGASVSNIEQDHIPENQVYNWAKRKMHPWAMCNLSFTTHHTVPHQMHLTTV